jgi:predicted dehydrogenase
VLAADFHLRYTPAVEQAREWVASGKIGTPLFINMNLWRDRLSEDGDDPNALFLSLGSHGIDMMRQFGGEIERVQCFGVRDAGTGAWSSAQVNMMCANDMVGNLTLSYDMVRHHPVARCEMAGSKARFVIDNVYEETTLYPHDDPIKSVLTNSIFGGIPQLSDTYARRIHALLEQIEGDDFTSDQTAKDACAAVAVMEAAVRAAERESVEEVVP